MPVEWQEMFTAIAKIVAKDRDISQESATELSILESTKQISRRCLVNEIGKQKIQANNQTKPTSKRIYNNYWSYIIESFHD